MIRAMPERKRFFSIDFLPYMFRFGHECSEVVYCKNFNVFEIHGVTDIQCVGCETFKAYESRGRTCCLECESRGKRCARSEASARCCLGKFFLPPCFQEAPQQQLVFDVKVSRVLKVEASGSGAGTN